MEFDLSKLNDREFEILGASIICKILNVKVETFKAGKDGGVDGRFWIDKEKEGIIQCKHYFNTPYKTLISKLKSEEVVKVKNLNPKKYILVTSQKLSRLNKKEIKEIFHPFIKRDDDIFGREDLIAFLIKKENQDIVEQNYKLWITSTSVLDLIYNNAIKGRSESTVRDIKENIYKYAVTENHVKGLKILETNNVVILTGEPGIGKTTLADNLALYYTAKGYEFCDIEESITEAENLFREKEKKKIIFYCDDFLGSNLYDAISNKRDSHIVKFINRVCKDHSKKFVLTSRTNILNKAYSLSHNFQNGKIRDNEFLLKVENLTRIDKARILYNHVYHSNLEKDYIDNIYKDKRYKDIIEHRNFNPRIIEFVTDKIRIAKTLPDEYWHYIKKNLDEPQDIWADYFQNQTDDCVRALTFLTVYNNGKISEDTLRRAYNKFVKIHSVNFGDYSDKSFEGIRKVAIKSLLNRNQVNAVNYEYILFNPSIADFVLSSYEKETDLITNILKSLETETSLTFLNTLIVYKKIDKECSEKIQIDLFDYFYEKKIKQEDWDFLILLVYIDFYNDNLKTAIEKFIKTMINASPPSGKKLSELLMILSDFEFEEKIVDYKFLSGFLKGTLDESTLKDLLNFIDKFSISDEEILSLTGEKIENYLDDTANNTYLDINYSYHVSHNYYDDGYADYNIDKEGIESEVNDILNSFLEDFNQSVLERVEYDTSSIVSNLDIDRMVMDHFDNQDYEPEPISQNSNVSSHDDDIDAIFERS